MMTKTLHLYTPPEQSVIFLSRSPVRTTSDFDLRNGRTDPRDIPRLILRSENRSTTDTTHTAESHKHGAAQGSLPLPADIVGLVGQSGGDIGVCAGGDEEDAEVASATRRGETHNGKTDQGDQCIRDKDWAADVEAVAEVGREDH